MNLLTLDNISHTFKKKSALHDCTVALPAGHWTTLLGPNGAGKSTLLRVAAGLLVPQRGTVILHHCASPSPYPLPNGRGEQMLSALTARARAQRIAYVPQQHTIAFALSVRDLILLGRIPHQHGLGFESTADVAAVATAMTQMQCEHLATRAFTTLSGGEQQRVLIARALAQQPQLLLLDEPTTHLDPAHVQQLHQRLQHLVRTHGLTICSVSHDINSATAWADQCVLMHDGKILAAGPPAHVCTAALLQSTFAIPFAWQSQLVAVAS